ncbi:hypothetical protein CJF31_00011703 [Rutstroemia sp. NJR-2017a BVV2]|nr:hypothetical protein CJF31_00011703 [Rutstroemia sp. NJR-2017a BVV2]
MMRSSQETICGTVKVAIMSFISPVPMTGHARSVGRGSLPAFFTGSAHIALQRSHAGAEKGTQVSNALPQLQTPAAGSATASLHVPTVIESSVEKFVILGLANTIVLPSTLEPPRTPWGRFKEKLRPGQRQEFKALLWATLCFIVSYVVIGILTVMHIEWNTKPYLHPDFLARFAGIEVCLSVACGVFYVLFAASLLDKYHSCVSKFFAGILESNNAPVNTARPRRRSWRDLIPGCFFLVLLTVYALPIIGVAGGPNIVWYNQMKNSCRGYNTRVEMWKNLGYGTESAYKYNFHSIDWTVEDHTYYLAHTFEPKVDSDDAYQYYYRFTGKTTNGGYLAVDIDYDNSVWRMLQLTGQDGAATWAAVGHSTESLIGSMPRFQHVDTTPMLNGTILFTDDKSHLIIPEMSFGVANLGVSFDHREVEPFIRVFNIANWSEDEAIERMSEPWSNKFDRDIVMRTASFGHGRQRIDMCIREGPFPGEWTQNVESGVSDYLIVPFAVIAATRVRLAEAGSSDASRYSGEYR